MSFVYEEELLLGAVSGLLSSFPSMLINIAAYVLSALALYTIAKRRGLNHPWLAWIPVASVWILGSLSDQYRYVARGENKAKRKSLLVLSILLSLISAMILVLAMVMVGQMFIYLPRGVDEAELLEMILGPVVGIVGLCLPLCGIAIAFAIIYYMALFDVYKSLDPNNSVLFLVLSILIGVTEPFFLFFNRGKDLGMPPRQEPVYYQPQDPGYYPPQPGPGYYPPQSEPQSWENEPKDYL